MKITDEMLFESASEAEDLWLHTLPDAKVIPEHKFSPKFERKMKKLIRKSRHSKQIDFILKSSKKVAIFCIIVFSLTFSGLMTVKAYREQFIQAVIEIYQTLTSFKFSSEENVEHPVGNISYSYFPDGNYKMEVIQNQGGRYYIEFKSVDSEDYIRVKQNAISSGSKETSYLDSEDAEQQQISINGYDGILLYKKGKTIIQWTTDYYVFQISSNLAQTEVIKFANGINLVQDSY